MMCFCEYVQNISLKKNWENVTKEVVFYLQIFFSILKSALLQENGPWNALLTVSYRSSEELQGQWGNMQERMMRWWMDEQKEGEIRDSSPRGEQLCFCRFNSFLLKQSKWLKKSLGWVTKRSVLLLKTLCPDEQIQPFGVFPLYFPNPQVNTVVNP